MTIIIPKVGKNLWSKAQKRRQGIPTRMLFKSIHLSPETSDNDCPSTRLAPGPIAYIFKIPNGLLSVVRLCWLKTSDQWKYMGM